MKHITLGTLAYFVATFTVQPVSHFVINRAHYASVPFLREEPLMILGMVATVIQGIVLAAAFPRFLRPGSAVRQGLAFGLLAGLFFASYMILVEPAKFAVPSIGSWIVVETTASLAQFALFGLLLGLIHRRHP